jgi:hypothetical protein
MGTGQGYSVLKMIRDFERVNGVSVPYQQIAGLACLIHDGSVAGFSAPALPLAA